MAIEIKVPDVGESITEGVLSRWFKKEGDPVRAGDPLFELETEKATTEVPAPAAGRLHIVVAEGQTIGIGSVIGKLEEGGEPASAPSPKQENSRKAGQATPDGRSAPPVDVPTPSATAKKAAKTVLTSPPAEHVEREARLSPSARRLIEEEGIDAAKVKGTGRGGLIIKEDVLQQMEQVKPSVESVEAKSHTEPAHAAEKPVEPAKQARETRQRMSSIRQRIAERLVAAQNTAAILTTFNEADMSAVIALRSQYKQLFQEKHNVGLGFMSFFVKAAVRALQAFPNVNAWIDGQDIVYPNYYHLGIAVSTDKGLMVPVLHDVNLMSFAEIEKRIAELSQKARDGKISVDDLRGGTFTITNGGVFGSLLSTPILNPPQSAILGMHAIQKRPVALDDQVAIRPMMYLALSYDHRLIDGREAVLFLARIKEDIEHPERMMLDI
jgi:2-oxoglutarate dehydrogenase E2 component (dihydrolipoamide succinyltransferase)